MDSKKLSLLVQAWRDRAPTPEGENKSYLAGQASAALCCADELEAALAQQAQPEVDCYACTFYKTHGIAGSCRDHAPQQAQPCAIWPDCMGVTGECANANGCPQQTRPDPDDVLHFADQLCIKAQTLEDSEMVGLLVSAASKLRLLVRGKPEMPTRKMIIVAIDDAFPGITDQRTFAELAADAVLALFAPKETTRPCAVCGQPPDFAKHWGTAADPAPVGNHDYE
jgi:hypothetical protein